MNAYAAVGDHEAEGRDIRHPVVVSGRMTWTDATGDDRSVRIRTENVSERGVLLECLSTTEIPLHRLVSLSLSTRARHRQELPNHLGLEGFSAESEEAFAVEVQPGDAAIHSSLTVHWSEANRSQRSRQAITYFYWAASCQGDEGGANSIRR